LSESCQSFEAGFSRGENDVGGRIVDPFNARWFLTRTIPCELLDVVCSHLVDPANVDFFVDRFLGEGINGII
jgi:hypothetical protein